MNWFPKIFETLVYQHIYNHVSSIISPKQHGFVTGRSTNSNLLIYTSHLCNSFDEKGQVDAIYTDFAKAFDRVSHSILLAKAEYIGINGDLLRWLTSYLNHRSQLVTLSGYDSFPFDSPSGVPQGSNLGPLLFLIFINDLLDKVKCECLAFADDIKIFSRVVDIQDCYELQRSLDLIECWCNVNHMSLNRDKCQVISFTKNRTPLNYNYEIGGHTLARVSVVRDLGVYYDSILSFRPHYDYICNKANQMLFFVLRHAKPFNSTNSWIILYGALVRSILEYCSSVWSPVYQNHTDRIEAIQRKFLRVLCTRCGLRRKICDYSDRLRHFNMTSLEKRRWSNDLRTLHKIANGFLGSDLLEMLLFKVPTRSVRIQRLFYVPPSRNNVSQNNPINRMCGYFNAICQDYDLFNCSVPVFKKMLSNL